MEFWKSRSFWTAVLQGVFNVLVISGIVTDVQVALYTNIILGILQIVFRWNASGPLVVSK